MKSERGNTVNVEEARFAVRFAALYFTALSRPRILPNVGTIFICRYDSEKRNRYTECPTPPPWPLRFLHHIVSTEQFLSPALGSELRRRYFEMDRIVDFGISSASPKAPLFSEPFLFTLHASSQFVARSARGPLSANPGSWLQRVPINRQRRRTTTSAAICPHHLHLSFLSSSQSP